MINITLEHPVEKGQTCASNINRGNAVSLVYIALMRKNVHDKHNNVIVFRKHLKRCVV